MSQRDREYFARRAETQLMMAQTASSKAAVAAHYRMACDYIDRASLVAGQGADTAGRPKAA